MLFLDHTESFACFLVYIGKQGIGQVVLVLKFLLSSRLICRYAEHHGTGLLQLLVRFAEPASFDGSAGSIGFGKKEQNYRLASEILQRHRFFVLIRQSEVRGFIINIHGYLSASLTVIPQE